MALFQSTAHPLRKSGASESAAGAIARVLGRPAILFAVLSLVFGTAIVFLDPPLRGHDEPAHVLRIYGIARGEVVRTAADEQGRKGIWLPAHLHDDFLPFFTEVEGGVANADFRRVFRDYQTRRAQPLSGERPPVFVLYGGSEGYTPSAYVPHIIAAWIARALSFDFLQMLYLMRWFGLVFMTAVATYAIWLTPHLKWAFFLVALLPAAIYGRAIVSADGGALSYAMVITALCLRAAHGGAMRRIGERAIWMFLCVLAKPPHVAFVALELMTSRLGDLSKRWRPVLLIVVPGLAATAIWVALVDAEIAVWRIEGTGVPREHFTLGWKLAFMIENPLHFPTVMLTNAAGEAYGLWRQLIGVLGWLDVPLSQPVYIAVSIALAVTAFERLPVTFSARMRIAFFALVTIFGYFTLVYLILWITWTPPEVQSVWGVQGRYFVVVLPALAIAIAALAHLQIPSRAIATSAIFGALVSGIASVEAIWRIHWG